VATGSIGSERIKLIFNKIYTHLVENDILTEKQSGYRPGHSTQIQLVYLTHQLYSALDKNLDFTTVYFDISKYFDKIWHEGLLFKCEKQCGISGSLLNWLKSYLSNRTQVVKIGENFSNPLGTHAGVPQGSVLGPLLALIYLNDLADKTVNDALFYADDTSLHAPHPHDSHDHRQSLQRDLDTIEQFGADWAISFSGPKTIQQTFTNRRDKQTIQLTFSDQEIPSVPSHKHLGLTLSTDLRFHDHVNTIIKTVNSLLGPIYPVAKLLPRHILNEIYQIYIRPHLDYCDIIYDGNISIADMTRLQTLQNRIGRLVTGALFRTSTDRLLDDLGWERLQTRRIIHKLLFFHRIFFNAPRLPTYITQIITESRQNTTGLNLRNASNLSMPKNRLNSLQHSFFPTTTHLWNQLPLDIRNTYSRHTFRKLIWSLYGNTSPPSFHLTGSKLGNIHHTRLRLGMSTLNAHLSSINHPKATSPECSCGHHTEDTKHFILHCPLYTQIRQQLLEALRPLITDFENLSNQQKIDAIISCKNVPEEHQIQAAHIFQTFILHTQRFTTT